MANTGYFPIWRQKSDGMIAPDERLPWGQAIVAGVQHVVAMFGATALAPILMGFDPNNAILFSGVGTLVFFVVTGGRASGLFNLAIRLFSGNTMKKYTTAATIRN